MSERLNRHPLSAAFPSMQQAEFEGLIEDVAKNGLAQPVITFDGMVLDGWHRYLACLESETEPRFEVFRGPDPVAYVLSLNLHRRHLTASQRAAAVVACHEWAPVGQNQHTGGAAPGAGPKTNKDLSEIAGTGERTIRQAKAAQKAGFGEELREGRMSAKQAAEIAKLPEEERAAAIEAPPEEKAPEQPKSDHRKIEALEAEIETLRAQNEEQRESIAEMAQLMAGLQEELDAAKRTLDAEDLLGQFNQEVARAHEAARVAKSRVGGLMSENAELKRRLGAALRKIAKFEKSADTSEHSSTPGDEK